MQLPFFRDRSEIAAMRDELIQARTSVVFLSDVLASVRRRREPRRDKAEIIAARAEMTKRLREWR